MSYIEQFGGRERSFPTDSVVVSKTDTAGRITYCNDIFIGVSGYTEAELLGKPHKIIRHPAMPKSVFKLFWDTLKAGDEVFAYVINRCKNGDYYWVSAHATPSRDSSGTVIGYHSNRRVPDRQVLARTIIPLYETLLTIERENGGGKKGMDAAHAHLMELLAGQGLAYDEWFFSL